MGSAGADTISRDAAGQGRRGVRRHDSPNS